MKTVKRPSGSRNAYESGYEEGVRYGGCQAVLERTSAPLPVREKWRVMYVPQGFDAIDRSVIRALREVTAELTVAEPADMLAQAKAWQPDLVLVMNSLHVFPADHLEQIDYLRSVGIRTAVWFVDDPYFSDDTAGIAPHYDVVFTHELSCIPLYRASGASQVHYLPLAADAEIFRPLESKREYRTDVCFIGNAFRNRAALFDALAPSLVGKKVVIAGGHWDRLSRLDLLGPYIRSGWVETDETVRYYNGAKIVINLHRPAGAGQDNRNGRDLSARSINPRTYEISACGTLQITDVREDLSAYYRPGYDLETFSSPEELSQKIEFYLANEPLRLQLAWRGLWTTRTKHSYHERISRLLQIAFGKGDPASI
ncbi:CgeB family protein [Paenibacillus sp. CAA11]|uniref:CgeB family protein n=1 Tax=Paenibacillus sp. CAA11 TaxID=1532905 RepID=UPI001F23634B|nr:DUF3880 domain-containing protein [Paenibacillus sp. CAA11]